MKTPYTLQYKVEVYNTYIYNDKKLYIKQIYKLKITGLYLDLDRCFWFRLRYNI